MVETRLAEVRLSRLAGLRALLPTITRNRVRHLGYAPVLAFAMALMLGRLLVMARLLSIEEFAVYSAATVVSGVVTMLACFGIFFDLQRTLPARLAKGQNHRAVAEIGRTLIGATLVAALCAGPGLLGLSIGYVSPQVLMLGVLHGLAQQMFLIVTTESRSDGEPMRFAVQNISRALALLAVSLGAVLWSRSGAVAVSAEAAVSLGFVIVISTRILRRLVPFGLSGATLLGWRFFKRTDWRVAVPLLLLSLAVAASMNVDRWISTIMLDTAGFARYSFGWLLLVIAYSAQGLVNASVFPLIARRAALAGARTAYRMAFKTSLALLVGATVAAAPGIYVAGLAIEGFYPQYEEARSLLPYLGIAAIFRISDFWSSYLVIVGEERQSLVLNLAATLVPVGALFSALSWQGRALTGADLSLLAMTISISVFLLSFWASWRHTTRALGPVPT